MLVLSDISDKHLEDEPLHARNHFVLRKEQLRRLIEVLIGQRYEVIGPHARDGAIVYERLTSLNDLPCGWSDQQTPGHCRLKQSPDVALFGHTVGPQSWKKFLYPPLQRLAKSYRLARGFSSTPEDIANQRYAFLGVRSCDLHAIALHDRIFLENQYVDPGYKFRRENAFIIAVNCGKAGETCFCVSMGTGPKATCSYDLALTELQVANEFRYVVDVGSPRGAEILTNIYHEPASEANLEAADQMLMNTSAHMGRSDGHCRPEGIVVSEHRTPDVGQRRRAMPVVRELHYGVSNLFLHHGGGYDRSYGRPCRALAALGFVFHPGFLLHSRGKHSRQCEIALSPVDDSQTGGMDRSVRQARLRGLRPLHYLVPCRH